jgi:hypothetical protein
LPALESCPSHSFRGGLFAGFSAVTALWVAVATGAAVPATDWLRALGASGASLSF